MPVLPPNPPLQLLISVDNNKVITIQSSGATPITAPSDVNLLYASNDLPGIVDIIIQQFYIRQ